MKYPPVSSGYMSYVGTYLYIFIFQSALIFLLSSSADNLQFFQNLNLSDEFISRAIWNSIFIEDFISFSLLFPLALTIAIHQSLRWALVVTIIAPIIHSVSLISNPVWFLYALAQPIAISVIICSILTIPLRLIWGLRSSIKYLTLGILLILLVGYSAYSYERSRNPTIGYCQSINSIERRGPCYLQLSIKEDNIKICNEIVDEEGTSYKQLCLAEFVEREIKSLGQDFNPERCEVLKNRDGCYLDASLILKDKNLCDKISGSLAKQDCSQQAKDNGYWFVRESPSVKASPSGEYIEVTSPAGGEDWVLGETYPIEFRSNYSDIKTFEVWLIANKSFYYIASNVKPSAGSVKWTIPNELLPGDNYKIGIYGGTRLNPVWQYTSNTFGVASSEYPDCPAGKSWSSWRCI